MYNPPHFQEKRPEALHQAIREIGIATLITARPSLEANLMPLFIKPEEGELGTLYGHFAKANPQARAEGEALAIFQGPDAYISPSWYPSKQENGKAVPTWNYIVVQARGELEFFTDPVKLLAMLEELTFQHEKTQAHPWQISDAPEDYTRALLKAIIGFRMPLKSLEGKWKLSQNRSPEDRKGMNDALAQREKYLTIQGPKFS